MVTHECSTSLFEMHVKKVFETQDELLTVLFVMSFDPFSIVAVRSMPLNDIDTEFLLLESQIITCVRRVTSILVSIQLLDLL